MKKSVISQQDAEVYLSTQAEQLFQLVDFSATFSITNHVHSLERIIRSIFTTQNRWVVYLFQLRNWLVVEKVAQGYSAGKELIPELDIYS